MLYVRLGSALVPYAHATGATATALAEIPKALSELRKPTPRGVMTSEGGSVRGPSAGVTGCDRGTCTGEGG